ncbi:MAG: hypothetical protein M1396_06720, partial [Chloroflexi bacterium]|nr:hypothetical protein [Chloroflexota bacterium]
TLPTGRSGVLTARAVGVATRGAGCNDIGVVIGAGGIAAAALCLVGCGVGVRSGRAVTVGVTIAVAVAAGRGVAVAVGVVRGTRVGAGVREGTICVVSW